MATASLRLQRDVGDTHPLMAMRTGSGAAAEDILAVRARGDSAPRTLRTKRGGEKNASSQRQSGMGGKDETRQNANNSGTGRRATNRI